MCGLLGRGDFGGVDCEVGAIHAAEIATAALFRLYYVRRVIALGVECGGERQDFGGTKFYAKAAGFAALNNDGNSAFRHRNPHGVIATPELESELCGGVVPAGCDAGHGWL